MSKTLGPVALKLGDEVLVKLRTNTTVQDLLEQLDKACKGGRIQDADGFDVTAHFSQDLPEGEYAIKQPTADTDAATDGGTKEGKKHKKLSPTITRVSKCSSLPGFVAALSTFKGVAPRR
ncbi:hypothetical protein WJX77_001696 [Trebouxia sp. C0004]